MQPFSKQAPTTNLRYATVGGKPNFWGMLHLQCIGSRDTRATKSEQDKLTQSKFIRGLVQCTYCTKPRCLYSTTSPSMMKLSEVNGAPEPTMQAIGMCRE